MIRPEFVILNNQKVFSWKNPMIERSLAKSSENYDKISKAGDNPKNSGFFAKILNPIDIFPR
jgi:hypothetical protein